MTTREEQTVSDKAVSKFTLVQGAFALFFMSFLMSGNGNALPQVFFQHHYPAQKTFLLSIALLSSTVAAVTGVLVSRRIHARRSILALSIGVTVLMAEALLLANAATLFIVCLALVQFADNFLLNQIDHAAVVRSGNMRGFNDGAGNAARLFGMLSAPAFFTLLASRVMAERIAIALLGAAAIAGCMQLFRLQPLTEKKKEVPKELSEPDRADWLVFGYAIAVYAALYLFAANMIYLLKDVFQIAGAETRGGIAIVVVFLSALAANGAVTAVRRSSAETSRRGLRTGAVALPALALIVTAGIVLTGFQAGYAICLFTSAVIGACYGVFLWEIRDYSSFAAKTGKTALLTWFNNMANISSLFAFGLMLALATRRSHAPAAYYVWLMRSILGVPTAGLIMLFFATVHLRQKAALSEMAV
jgi:hypothetical protein